MSETQRAVDALPCSARIARAAARPSPGLATAVLCALALAVPVLQGALRPAVPARAQRSAQLVRVSARACTPLRAAAAGRDGPRSTPRSRKAKAAAHCVRV